MEHLVIRNAAMNGAESVPVPDTGTLAESRIGRPFRKLGPDGQPTKIRSGETLWIAEAGYGVIAECVIAAPVITHELRSPADLTRIKELPPLKGLSPTYWNELAGKLTTALSQNQSLFVSAVPYQLVRRVQFPLIREKGARNSWIEMDEDKKATLFGRR
jgi:hypothetical protein